MTDVIGRGTIEVTADATKLKAGIEDAKKSVRSLGDANKEASTKASASIDRYISRLQVQQKTQGMSTREAELYKLALRGATVEQIKAADSALKLTDAYQKGAVIGEKIRTGFIAIAAASVALGAGAAFATNKVIGQIASYQGLSEKIGDTASNVASLKEVTDISGVSFDTVAAASVRLTASLSKTDDESKAVGSALSALNLNFDEFKKLSPVAQLDTAAKAMGGFADGSEKTAIAVALFGKAGADLIPFLNDLSDAGELQVRLTDEQIKAADAYTKSIDRLSSQMSSFVQVTAAGAVPTLQSVQSIFAQLAKDETTVATATDLMIGAMSGAVVLFQTIAVVGSDVGFVFLGVGREIAAVAAQLNALARGDLAGFRAISDAVKEDGERARAELDKFQSKVMSIGQPVSSSQPSTPGSPAKPKINISGLAAGGSGGSDQIAKAQLASDLEQIKKASEATVNAYANAEKILEARRAASLIDDQEYYAAKLGFLNLNSDAQEQALQKEIDRLSAEKLVGKDKIDNARKIAEAESKLSKLRADAVANIEILSIQEVAANDKIAQSYADATIAAQAYIDTVKRQNDAEIAGVGRGTKSRAEQAGRNQIEDKFTGQRQSLERDKRNNLITQQEYDTYLAIAKTTFEKEIALYDERTAAINAAQGDWVNGANEAMSNYYDNAKNVAGGVEQVFGSAFQGMEDAFVDFAMTGKASFADLAKSIIADIIRIQAKQAIAGLVGGSASGGSSSGGMFGSLISAGLSMFGGGAGTSVPAGRAIGGPVSAGGLYRVNENRPELLNVAGKQYLMMGNQSGSVDSNVGGSGGVNVNVTVDASGSSAQGDSGQAEALGIKIGTVIRSVIIQEKRPGGILAT